MTWNVLNYPGSTGPTRNPYFRTVITATNPDILVVGELGAVADFNAFRDSVIKKVSLDYAAGAFVDGPDSDHAIFFKSAKFKFISNVPIATELRDISQFTMASNLTNDTIIIYAVHLKASNTTADRDQRAREVDSLRKVTDRLHPGANFIVLGDFNFYGSTEPAYIKLLNTATPGYFIDHLKDSMSGTWNSASFSRYHTQSPRVRSFGGGATGGMDDRFDLILMSQNVRNSGGISFVPNSYIAYGNDGNHFNDSINRPPNTAVGQVIADAIHYASDHIPVIATFEFDTPLPVELVSFLGKRVDGSVVLNWQTATEVNNMGFDIQRSEDGNDWSAIDFVPGHNTSNSPKYYTFTDQKTPSGHLYYRLKQIDNDGTTKFSNLVEIGSNLPRGFSLKQNYPNPFNPETNIDFEIPSPGTVTLTVYDVLGSEVTTLLNGYMNAGSHSVKFDPAGIPAGTYYYKLGWNNFTLTGKMIFLP